MTPTEIARRADALHQGPTSRRQLCERLARVEALAKDAIRMMPKDDALYWPDELRELIGRARELRLV